MTWVKICGITNLEDALMAVEAGADALGFVFYEKSSRNVAAVTVQEIVKKLPENIETVGVFVNRICEDIRDIVLQTGLTAVQLNDEKTLARLWQNRRPIEDCVGVSKVIPVVAGDVLKEGGILISNPVVEKSFAILVDSRSNGSTGGTGSAFDWEGARGMVQGLSLKIPVIIAGGLTAANVANAIQLFQPFGVDVATGVEARPGKKDPEKVKAFIHAARVSHRHQ